MAIESEFRKKAMLLRNLSSKVYVGINKFYPYSNNRLPLSLLSDSSLTNAISSESKFEAQAGTGKLPGNDPRFRFGNSSCWIQRPLGQINAFEFRP